jgi:hypothetical protein
MTDLPRSDRTREPVVDPDLEYTSPPVDADDRALREERARERRIADERDDVVVEERPVVERPVEERPVYAERPVYGERTVDDDGTVRDEVVERQREQFGGMKFGSAFFGWLAATGTAVLLTALLAALGAALGLGVTEEAAADDPGTITLVGAILLAVVLFVSYFAGGYVAGRMARFSGARQGIAVWLWAIIAAVVVALVGAIWGSQFNILATLNSFPRIPINEGDLTVAGIVTAAIVAGITLFGAILGGMAGMAYHRRVDRVGLPDAP